MTIKTIPENIKVERSRARDAINALELEIKEIESAYVFCILLCKKHSYEEDLFDKNT
jgi:hypothetical protein